MCFHYRICDIAEYCPICCLRLLDVALDFYIVILLRPFLSSVDVVIVYSDHIAIIHDGVVRITCVHVAIIIDVGDHVCECALYSYHWVVGVDSPHCHSRYWA